MASSFGSDELSTSKESLYPSPSVSTVLTGVSLWSMGLVFASASSLSLYMSPSESGSSAIMFESTVIIFSVDSMMVATMLSCAWIASRASVSPGSILYSSRFIWLKNACMASFFVRHSPIPALTSLMVPPSAWSRRTSISTLRSMMSEVRSFERSTATSEDVKSPSTWPRKTLTDPMKFESSAVSSSAVSIMPSSVLITCVRTVFSFSLLSSIRNSSWLDLISMASPIISPRSASSVSPSATFTVISSTVPSSVRVKLIVEPDTKLMTVFVPPKMFSIVLSGTRAVPVNELKKSAFSTATSSPSDLYMTLSSVTFQTIT